MKQAYTNTIRGNKGPLSIQTGPKNSKSRQKHKVPMCKYGVGCTRRGCIYSHPEKNKKTGRPIYDSYQDDPQSKICLPFLSHMCEFGKGCLHRHPGIEEADRVRATYKSKMCTYGDGCMTEGCLYFHSWDAAAEVEEMHQQFAEDPLSTEVGRLAIAGLSLNVSSAEFVPGQGSSVPHQPFYAPTYTQWMQMECPSPPGLWHDEQYNYSVWNYPGTGMQRPYEEVYAMMYGQQQHGICSTVPSFPASQPPPAPTQEPSGWAAVAAKKPSPAATAQQSNVGTVSRSVGAGRSSEKVSMPPELWLPDTSKSDYFYLYPDPVARFIAVNEHHRQVLESRTIPTTLASPSDPPRVTLLDVHFQSARTVSEVLDEFLPKALDSHDEVWIVTGSGRHVAVGHQKKEKDGLLFNAVRRYLDYLGRAIDYRLGRDGGAIVVCTIN